MVEGRVGGPRARAVARRTALAVAAAVAGCGGAADSGDPAARGGPPDTGVYGQAPAAVGGVPSVVMLTPEDAPPTLLADTANPTIDQLGLQFTPRLVLAAPGEQISFTNSESIAHNVIVRPAGGGDALLNADTPSGESVTLALQEVGAYDVTCEIHPGMTALIFVTEAPFATFADADGAFRLPDVPPGRYQVEVWSTGSPEATRSTVRVREGEATEVVTSGME